MGYTDLGTFQNSELAKEEIKLLLDNIEGILTKLSQGKNKMTLENANAIYQNFIEIKIHLNHEGGMNLSFIFNRLHIIKAYIDDVRNDREERFDKLSKVKNINKKSLYGILNYIGKILEDNYVDISILNNRKKVYEKLPIYNFREKTKYRVEKIIFSH